MIKHSAILCIMVLVAHAPKIFGTEYLYPIGVATSAHEPTLYVMYQKSIDHLELWLWNMTTKVAVKGLLSTYTPAGVQECCDQQSFSFIDNDRIRIKSFLESSPSILMIDEPLYDISVIHWINTNSYYLSAKKGNHVGIFEVTTQGECRTLLYDNHRHYRYPQKLDTHLFCITQNDSCYSIIKSDYLNPHADKTTLHESMHPIIFLAMHSDTQGFFIEHTASIQPHHMTIACSYYSLKKHGAGWQAQKLFDFLLPTHLVLAHHAESCLHETLLPLIPKHIDNAIYFSSADFPNSMMRRRTSSMGLFSYDLVDQRIDVIASEMGSYFFSPVRVGNRVYYGGAVQEGESPYMWMNENAEICLELPNLKI